MARTCRISQCDRLQTLMECINRKSSSGNWIRLRLSLVPRQVGPLDEADSTSTILPLLSPLDSSLTTLKTTSVLLRSCAPKRAGCSLTLELSPTRLLLYYPHRLIQIQSHLSSLRTCGDHGVCGLLPRPEGQGTTSHNARLNWYCTDDF